MVVTSSRDKEAKINEFLEFLNESWTAFHAVAEARRMLINAGFEELNERECCESKLRRNGGYINYYLEVLFWGVTLRKCYLLLEYCNVPVLSDQSYLIPPLHLFHDGKGNTF